VAILFLSLIVASWRCVAIAAQSGPSLEETTNALVNLHGQQVKAGGPAKAAILTRLQNVAATRYQLLAAAVEADPGALLKVALPASFRRGFPAALRRYLEEEIDLDGNLEVLHEDRAQGSRYVYKLESLGQEYSLHFKKEPPTHLTSGARVRVRGVRLNNAIALESARGAVQTLAAVAPDALSDQSTLVILVNFRNHPVQPYDGEFAAQLFFNTTSDFFFENSYQQTYLNGVVKGWYTIDMDNPTSDATCNYSQISNLADRAAASAGVVLSDYRRKVYAFPQSGCGWWGLGTIGGNPSRAWINGTLQLRVAAHEIGHNLGLYHSHSLDCGTDPVGGACSAHEYGDTLDTMGATAYHFNAFQKERLGWLAHGTAPPITTAQGSGSYALYPYESNDNGPKALKILRWTNLTNGRNSYFYAECRRPVGFDSGLSDNANVLNGFVIRSAEESNGNSSYLLDMSPADGAKNWYEPALMVGYSFTDPVSGVTITPEAPCGDTAGGSIAVTFEPSTCAIASPDISLSPNTVQWLMPGGSTTYTIALTNNDGSDCGAADFQIAPAIRSGWTATAGTSVLAIAPGATAVTTLTVTSPVLATDGFYSFSASATRAGSTSSGDIAGGGLLVVSSLVVEVSTNKSVYKRGQISTITATVIAAGSPVANAPVVFSIDLPDGRKAATKAVTTLKGVAKFKLRTSKRDPRGIWRAQADTTMGGLAVNGTTNFTVN
jgi:hypothetical protein